MIVQGALFPYRRKLYTLLREELWRRKVDLRLIHSHNKPDSRHWSAARSSWVEYVEATRLRVGNRRLTWNPVARRVSGADLVVLQDAVRRIENYVLVGRRSNGPPAALWGHGTDHSEGRSALTETARRWMIRRAHWYFAYTEGAARRVEAHGMPAERVTVLRNATDARGLAEQIEVVRPADIEDLRRDLELTGEHVGVFVGTVRPNKRPDFLIDAADRVRHRIPNFELVIAGRNIDLVEPLVAGRDWIRLSGPVYDEDLAVLLAAAEVVLVPAWAGLVIVDAFAAGLPVVASRSHAHPPEIEYLEDEVNGLYVDDRGDPSRFGDAVADLLLDGTRLAKLSEGAHHCAGRYTLEGMVQRFATGIERALASPD